MTRSWRGSSTRCATAAGSRRTPSSSRAWWTPATGRRASGARSLSGDLTDAVGGRPDVDHQVGLRRVEADRRHLSEFEPERVAGFAVVLGHRLLVREAGDLRLAGPVVVGIEGGAVQ